MRGWMERVWWTLRLQHWSGSRAEMDLWGAGKRAWESWDTDKCCWSAVSTRSNENEALLPFFLSCLLWTVWTSQLMRFTVWKKISSTMICLFMFYLWTYACEAGEKTHYHLSICETQLSYGFTAFCQARVYLLNFCSDRPLFQTAGPLFCQHHMKV